MRRSLRSMLGATLLEVMLVLSIVALIILMSVRYYQSATIASQTEQVMGIISAITAAADNLSLGTAGGYSNVNNANMSSLIGTANMNSPWGGTITVAGSASNATTYNVTIPKPTAGVCTAVKLKLAANTKFQSVACTAGGTLTYTYNSTC